MLHHRIQVVEAGGSSPKLAAGPVLVASPEHPHALAHACEGRFDRSPVVECFTQFERRTMDIPIRIRPKLSGEALNPSEDSLICTSITVIFQSFSSRVQGRRTLASPRLG